MLPALSTSLMWFLGIFGPPLLVALVRAAYNFVVTNAKRLEDLAAMANTVMTNHLPHIQESLNTLNQNEQNMREQIEGLREDFRTYFATKNE